MITPEFLNAVVVGTEEAVSRLNENLTKQIAKSIRRSLKAGEDTILPSTISDMMKIAQSGYSIQQVQAIIEKEMPDIQSEVREAFKKSAAEIASYANRYTADIAEGVGIDADLPSGRTANAMTKKELTILENAYKRTNATMRNLTKTTASNAYADYIQGCNDAYMKAQAGMSLDKAIAQTVDDLAKKGVTTITYYRKDGSVSREDSIDVAVARAVRTGINQANSEIILQRCASLGIGYVKVSQHLGARVTKADDYTNHSWWQGGIYKLDWRKPPLNQYGDVDVKEPRYSLFQRIKKAIFKRDVYNYPDFVDTCGYGKIEGIIGVNCRHTFMMWQPGINIDTDKPIDKEANEKRYNIEQNQRALERSIRKIKRRIEAQKAVGTDSSKANVKRLKDILNDKIAGYEKYCRTNGVAPYWERTR